MSLSDAFGNDTRRRFLSRVFNHYDGSDARTLVAGVSNVRCLVLIGHSLGGRAAMRMATDLHTTVDMLVQIDSVGLRRRVPEGVHGVNYYQTGREPLGYPKRVRGSRNVHVEPDYHLSNGQIITHTNIDDALFGRTPADYDQLFGAQPDLHVRIKDEIEEICS